jgi:hypothetical protein
LKKFCGREDGQMVILVAILMGVLLLTIGLAMDAGALFSARRTMQKAADAGAWAGAVVLYNGGSAASAQTAATTDTSINGYSGAAVTAVVPPTSGPYAGQSTYIEVVITMNVPTRLIPPGGGLTTVRVRSVGGAAPAANGYALMALNPTLCQSLHVSSNGNVNVSGGGVIVDSNCNPAADRTSGGNMFLTAPATANVVGGQVGFTGWNTGVAPAPDPLANYPMPPTTGLPVFTNTVIGNTDQTLSPGVYVNGIVLGGSGSALLQPGMYILKDGGIQSSSGGGITGSGVTLFNTRSSYPGVGGTCNGINLTSSGSLNISAPVSGPYKGMLIYQDPACTAPLNLSSNGAINSVTGTIYAPTAQANLSSNGSMTINGQLIVDNATVTSNGNININWSAGNTAQAILPSLVE